jgi:hypothetical protein
VVHIPVHDGDAPREAPLDHGLGGDCDVVQQAEPPAAVTFGVMPGRSDERVGVTGRAGHHGGSGTDCPARGKQRDVVAALAERRVLAGITAAVGAQPRKQFQVVAMVHCCGHASQ